MKRISLYIITIILLLFPSFVLAQDVSVPGPQPISLERALKLAPDEGKKILIDVFATWCPYCKRMHSEVYPSDAVQEAISKYFLWVKIDVESDAMVNYHGEEMTEAQFAQALENQNVPTVYFLNDEGAIIGSQPGYLEEAVFSNLLNFVGSDAYLDQSFKEYTEGE